MIVFYTCLGPPLIRDPRVPSRSHLEHVDDDVVFEWIFKNKFMTF